MIIVDYAFRSLVFAASIELTGKAGLFCLLYWSREGGRGGVTVSNERVDVRVKHASCHWRWNCWGPT